MIPLTLMISDAMGAMSCARNFSSRSKSPIALVCALAVLTLSACSRGEKSRFTDDSLAALVPAEAKMVFEVDVPTMLRTFETVTGE